MIFNYYNRSQRSHKVSQKLSRLSSQNEIEIEIELSFKSDLFDNAMIDFGLKRKQSN